MAVLHEQYWIEVGDITKKYLQGGFERKGDNTQQEIGRYNMAIQAVRIKYGIPNFERTRRVLRRIKE